MRILLVRHADAVSESRSLPDEHRYLSPAGRHQVRELCALIAEVGLDLGAVVTSPLVRAVQTAELLVRWLDWTGPIEASHYMAPGSVAPLAIGDWLSRCAEPLGGAVLAAVGHEPSISQVAQALSGGMSGPAVPAFAKSESCFLEDGAIRWRLAPG
ncbi:MAG TPA: histidine phosphatase family protein [Candidatus Acidoferrum sp.]|nr:histidine phosphatase family protein [Candidatus Acidoferrum sp.]